MTAALDWTDPAQVAEEARRRQRARAEGRSLHAPEPVIMPVSKRRWPPAAIELPRPRSLAREVPDEQREVIKVFHRFGCRAESNSQTKRVQTAVGIPDLWVWFLPIGRAGWFEVKSGEHWQFSGPQLEWAERCLTTNTLYGAGDRFSADTFCRALGLKEI